MTIRQNNVCRFFVAAIAAILLSSMVGVGATTSATAQAVKKGSSGLPVPRFVSLKSDRVNVRGGPGRDHEVLWIFVRAGLPVEVVQEFENWRRIRDSEGTEGWVFHSLLSGRRSALVAPWEKVDSLAAHETADAASKITAFLQPGVLADVHECANKWCRIGGDSWSGWIEQTKLWGVYADEEMK